MLLTNEQYDAVIQKQHRSLMKEYGEAKVKFSRDQLTEAEFSAACRELLRDYWTQYFDVVTKQADDAFDERELRMHQHNIKGGQ